MPLTSARPITSTAPHLPKPFQPRFRLVSVVFRRRARAISNAAGPASVFHCRFSAVRVVDTAIRLPRVLPERPIQPRRAPVPALRDRSRSARALAPSAAAATALSPESPRSLSDRASRVKALLQRMTCAILASTSSPARQLPAAVPVPAPGCAPPGLDSACRMALPERSREARGFAESCRASSRARVPCAWIQR